MSINTDFLKNRLKQLQSRKGVQANVWKPKPGETRIRIVPYKFNRENPFIELQWHWQFNGKNLVSPTSFGESDPIVEFAEKLRATGEAEDFKSAKDLYPKLRTYVPIVVRGEEDQGVKFWGFGITIYEALIKLMTDPEWGDITHPNTGRDIVVEFKTAKESGKDFPQTSIRPSPNQQKLTSDAKVLKSLLNDQVKITDVYNVLSYDELKDELESYLNGGSDAESSSTGDEVDTEYDSVEDSSDEDLDAVMNEFDDMIED